MDKQYIKMCDCLEIQNWWEPREGDRVFYYRRTWEKTDNSTKTAIIEPVETIIISSPSQIQDKELCVFLPRQEDWQNMLFSRHYAPAIPDTARKIRGAMIIMLREHIDYMEAWEIEQPCEAWARLYMNQGYSKTWTEKGWI